MKRLREREFEINGRGMQLKGLYDLATRVVVELGDATGFAGLDLWQVESLCEKNGWALRTSGGFRCAHKRRWRKGA